MPLFTASVYILQLSLSYCDVWYFFAIASRDIPLSEILPSEASLDALRQRMIVIVERVLVQQLPFLRGTPVTKHVLHEYSTEMAERSEVV